MTDEKRAEFLMDHYKDTYDHLLAHWKARNRLFMYILVLLAALALDMAKPGSLADLANRSLNKALPAVSDPKAKQPAPDPVRAKQAAPDPMILDFSVVGSLGWFLLLCLVVQYYQRSVHVDRQYKYIDDVEREISRLMGGDYVTREGRSYLSRKGAWEGDDRDCRPAYLRAVGPLYVHAFPVFLSVFVAVKMYRDHVPPHGVTDFLNLVMGFAIIIYTVLYLRWVIQRR